MSIFALIAPGLGYLVAFAAGAITAVILVVGRGHRGEVARRVIGDPPARTSVPSTADREEVAGDDE